jgi:hypothetical protein
MNSRKKKSVKEGVAKRIKILHKNKIGVKSCVGGPNPKRPNRSCVYSSD